MSFNRSSFIVNDNSRGFPDPMRKSKRRQSRKLFPEDTYEDDDELDLPSTAREDSNATLFLSNSFDDGDDVLDIPSTMPRKPRRRRTSNRSKLRAVIRNVARGADDDDEVLDLPSTAVKRRK